MRRAGMLCAVSAAALLCLVSAAPAAVTLPDEPPAGSVIVLTVAGTVAGHFPAVSGIGSSNEIVEQLVTGPSGSIARKIPGRMLWSDVLLERGVTANRFLWDWRRTVETGADTYRRNFDLALVAADGSEVAHWYCFNGWPSRISAPRSESGLAPAAVEAVTLVSEGCYRGAVADTTPPALDLPGDLAAEATSAAGAAVTYAAGAYDAFDPAPAISCIPASGSAFPLGATTVTCTATDASGNGATGSFTVTVEDTTAPVLTLPADIVTEASSPAGVAASFTVTAADLVDPGPSVSCDPPSGSTFPLGATTVSCTATDDAGNDATGSFKVTVQDTTAPQLTLPADIITEATSPSGAAVSFTATATDIVDSDPTVICAPPSGSTFPLGATTVSCTATDDAGNDATGSFSVTVRDTTDPQLTLPADIVAEATSPSGAAVSFTATATDIVDSDPTVICAPPSGSTFPLGATTVSCTATDDAGNGTPGSFSVTVRDTTNPSLTVPADIDAEAATSATGAAVSFTATATDIVDSDPTVVCAPPSGSTFPLGATTVSCTATDDAGNSATGSFKVTVQDTTDPQLTLPADIVAEATSPSGAAVSFTATATDIVDSDPTVVCAPPSGSTFPLGATTVSCTATDDAGNGATGSFKVTVQDTTAPQLTLPADIITEATSPSGATATFTATALDIVDTTPTILCVPPSGSTFPLGATTVSCTATDDAGNSTPGSFKVTVQDTTAPGINVQIVESAPFTTVGPLTIRYTVTDTGDASPTATVVFSNNGDPYGPPPLLTAAPRVSVPATAIDIALDPRALAGRNAVRVTATDAAGNTAQAELDFEVVLRLSGIRMTIAPDVMLLPVGLFMARIVLPAPYDAWTIRSAVADGAPSIKRKVRTTRHGKHVTSLFFRRSQITPPVDTTFAVRGIFLYKGATCTFEATDGIRRVFTGGP